MDRSADDKVFLPSEVNDNPRCVHDFTSTPWASRGRFMAFPDAIKRLFGRKKIAPTVELYSEHGYVTVSTMPPYEIQ